MDLPLSENTTSIFVFRWPFPEPDRVRMCPIISNEHAAKRYVRSGLGQPLAPENSDKPGASSCQQETPENSEVM
jgi:hypothetical protein